MSFHVQKFVKLFTGINVNTGKLSAFQLVDRSHKLHISLVYAIPKNNELIIRQMARLRYEYHIQYFDGIAANRM